MYVSRNPKRLENIPSRKCQDHYNPIRGEYTNPDVRIKYEIIQGRKFTKKYFDFFLYFDQS